MSTVRPIVKWKEKLILLWDDHPWVFFLAGVSLSIVAVAFALPVLYEDPYYSTTEVFVLGDEYVVSVMVPDRIMVGSAYWASVTVEPRPNTQPKTAVTATLALASPFLMQVSGGSDGVQVSSLASPSAQLSREQLSFQVLGTTSGEADLAVRALYRGESYDATLHAEVDHFSRSLRMLATGLTGIPGMASVVSILASLARRLLSE
jgi:hypothetical protein